MSGKSLPQICHEFIRAFKMHPDYAADMSQCVAVVRPPDDTEPWDRGAKDAAAWTAADWLQQRYWGVTLIAPVPADVWRVVLYFIIHFEVVKQQFRDVRHPTRQQGRPHDLIDAIEKAARECRALSNAVPVRILAGPHYGRAYSPEGPVVLARVYDSSGRAVYQESDAEDQRQPHGPRPRPYIVIDAVRGGAGDLEAAWAALNRAWPHYAYLVGRDIGRRPRGGQIDYLANMRLYRAWRSWQDRTGDQKPTGFLKAVFNSDPSVQLAQWRNRADPPTWNGLKKQLEKARKDYDPSDGVPQTLEAYLAGCKGAMP